jgi:hypothetical protein
MHATHILYHLSYIPFFQNQEDSNPYMFVSKTNALPFGDDSYLRLQISNLLGHTGFEPALLLL